jgi:rhamnosyltransferase
VTAPLVSIVIPTLNGMRTLPALVDAIAAQNTSFAYETIAVDSGSLDGTTDYLTPHVQDLMRIPRDEFNHGTTRNRGIEAARGSLVVLIVQDAQPASSTWLARLVAPLLSDNRVAGAFARQIPHPEASAITRHYLSRWIASSPESRVVECSGDDEWAAWAPLERLERSTFDNVCSVIRRDVWQKHPFRATSIAEDVEWSKEVLLAGYRIAYAADAVVAHSHERSSRYELARTWALHQRLYVLFGVRTIPTIPALVRAILSTAALHRDCLRTAGPVDRVAALRGLGLACAWPLGQYLGGWSAAHDRHHWRPGGV